MKQRVIGAIVLVAIAVIVLPILLQGPEADRGLDDVPLDVPSEPDRPVVVRELPLNLPTPTPAPDTTEPAQPVPSNDAEHPPTDQAAATDGTAAAGPDAPSQPSTATSGAPAGEPVVAVTADAPARIDALADPTGSAASPPSPASSEPPAVATGERPAALAGGDHVVQLGSYRDLDKARSLRDSVLAAGLPAFLEPTQTGGQTVHRLRLGPYAGRGAAEAARLQARRLWPDLPAQVVALERAAAASDSPSTVRAGFVVQLAAYSDLADANRLRDRLRAAGFASFTERIDTASGVLHRVRVGPEIERAAADRVRERIKTELGLDGLVVAFP